MSGALDALIRGTMSIFSRGVTVSPPRARLNFHSPLKASDESALSATAIDVDIPALQLALNTSAVSMVTDWYVDASLGHDSNDGLTPSTPFQTIEHLCDVLCPSGRRLTIAQDVTVHLAAGVYGRLQINVGGLAGFAYFFSIVGAITAGPAITLATVTNTNPAVARGRITTASGTFVDKKRIRVTSGASPDAVAFCCGLTSTTDAFVSGWTDATVTTVDVASTNVVTVDDLATSFTDPVELEIHGQGGIILQDVQALNGGIVHSTANADSIQIYRCDVGGTWSGKCSFFACRFPNATNVENGWFRFAGNAYQANIVASRNCYVLVEGSNLSDGASFQLTEDARGFTTPGSGEPANATWEFERGTGSIIGIVVGPGCFFDLTGNILWGLTGNYLVGVSVTSCASVKYSALPSIPSTTNASIAGTAKAWGALPFVDTTHLSGMVI